MYMISSEILYIGLPKATTKCSCHESWLTPSVGSDGLDVIFSVNHFWIPSYTSEISVDLFSPQSNPFLTTLAFNNEPSHKANEHDSIYNCHCKHCIT